MSKYLSILGLWLCIIGIITGMYELFALMFSDFHHGDILKSLIDLSIYSSPFAIGLMFASISGLLDRKTISKNLKANSEYNLSEILMIGSQKALALDTDKRVILDASRENTDIIKVDEIKTISLIMNDEVKKFEYTKGGKRASFSMGGGLAYGIVGIILGGILDSIFPSKKKTVIHESSVVINDPYIQIDFHNNETQKYNVNCSIKSFNDYDQLNNFRGNMEAYKFIIQVRNLMNKL